MSTEGKIELASKVHELIKSGKKTSEACREIGLGVSTYYYWANIKGWQESPGKKIVTKKVRRVVKSYKAIPMIAPLGGFELKGSPEEIARFIKEIGRIHE